MGNTPLPAETKPVVEVKERTATSPFSKEMTFAKALHELTTGKKVRGIDWENPDVHLAMVDEKVKIFTEDQEYLPLTVSLGDIKGMWAYFTGEVHEKKKAQPKIMILPGPPAGPLAGPPADQAQVEIGKISEK